MVLDRSLTERIANTVARGGAGPGKEDGTSTALPADIAAICADAEERVVAYTGLEPDAPLPRPEAVGRPGWIAANVNSMAAMLEPLGGQLAGALGPLGAPVRALTTGLMSAEAGALTGYMSQRVLGQYEFVLIDPASPARLLFVAPNIAKAAARLEADHEQLLTWIAFHEVTHAVQFAGVRWLRPHLAGLLGELLSSLELKVDPRSLRLPGADDAKAWIAGVRAGGLIAALAGDRRELLDRVQAVMGVIEGHAEHVMDVVGADALPALGELRSALDRRRRERPPLLALLDRLIGLDAKMRQYEDGKRFCDTIVDAAGSAALHSVFVGPERLPTLAELRDPEAWMDRAGVSALA